MSPKQSPSRWKIFIRAWPLPAAVFMLLSFVITVWWLWNGIAGLGLDWLEPLAAMLGGLGAFTLAAVLIFRRVDSARSEAETYRLARGLATGYYFNFVRPLVSVLRDANHPLHGQIRSSGDYQLAGLVIGIPQTADEFDPGRHAEMLKSLTDAAPPSFELRDISVTVAHRPRPIVVKLAVSCRCKTALLVDIPTTLAVVADFAEFVAQREAAAAYSDDEFVTEARKQIVVSTETARFHELLEEFLDVIGKAGALENRAMSPATLVHVVPFSRLKRRLDELADH